MKNRLLGTTAIVSAALSFGTFIGGAAAQAPPCPGSSLTGTGNVSNAICNYAGTPVPFTLTINLDYQGILQGDMGNKPTNINGVQGNQGGPGNKDYGFFQDAWFRFGFDAPGDDGTHYGFHANLLANSNIQPAVASKGGFGYTIVQNNTADHSPSQIDREYFFIKNARWGQVQFGAGPNPTTANFPYTFGPGGPGWGPPGPALQTVGPDGGIETQAIADPTAFGIDATASVLGADGYRDKAAMHIRYISPNIFGSDEDHGFNLDVSFAPDGRGHDEGNFRTDSQGANGNPDLGWSRPPTQQLQGQMNIFDIALTWDDVVGKDLEFAAGVGLVHGFAKGGGNPTSNLGGECGSGGTNCMGQFGGIVALNSIPGFPGAVNTIGHVSADHPANADLNVLNTGASVTFMENLTVGTDFTYAGKSMYPANTPAWDSYGHAHSQTPGWGFSAGVEYDWDRYESGIYYQYANTQGDMADYGYIQMQYIGLGASVKILKGLKFFGETMFYMDRNNHSPATIVAGGCGGGGLGGMDTDCKRSSNGAIFIVGTSLDF